MKPGTPSLDTNADNALYTVAEVRAIEQNAMASLPPHTLMQRAGKAAAELALALIDTPNARVLAVAGPGNNGGDAIEAASHLCQTGMDAQVLLMADPASFQGDAALSYQRAIACSVPFHAVDSADLLFSQSWNLVLDGLLGIGLARPIDGAIKAAVESINRLDCPVLALDVPSGLDADTGNVVGQQSGIAVRATHTITFIADKPGLHTGMARDHVGDVTVERLGIAPALLPPARASRNAVAAFAEWLTPRRHDSHKGSFGDVTIIGGAHGMTGAPILGARAALHCGAGRVHVGFVDPGMPADSGQPELMCRDAALIDFARGVLVAGPGMGDSRVACDLLARAVGAALPLLLDADALNLIAAEDGLRARLTARRAPTLLTPHPLEAARLLRCSASTVQADRPAAARELAASLNAIVLLKGSGTVIASPDGQIAINTTGNPALATAGTGDVLAGMTAALMAQHWPAREAALGAAWLHGAAADRLVQQGTGPVGLTASELIPVVRVLLNEQIAATAMAIRTSGPR